MNKSEAGKKGYEQARESLEEYHAKRGRELRDAYAADPKRCLEY